jgi:hypothetical protein
VVGVRGARVVDIVGSGVVGCNVGAVGGAVGDAVGIADTTAVPQICHPEYTTEPSAYLGGVTINFICAHVIGGECARGREYTCF